MSEEPERREGPTELVEGADGELIERLSGGTATLLLVWLIQATRNAGQLNAMQAQYQMQYWQYQQQQQAYQQQPPQAPSPPPPPASNG